MNVFIQYFLDRISTESARWDNSVSQNCRKLGTWEYYSKLCHPCPHPAPHWSIAKRFLWGKFKKRYWSQGLLFWLQNGLKLPLTCPSPATHSLLHFRSPSAPLLFFCGPILWTFVVGTFCENFCGQFLWPVFVDTFYEDFCEHFLLPLFFNTLCRHFS